MASIKIILDMYIKYQITVLLDLALLFKHICINHLESTRAARIFSNDERNHILHEITSSTNKFRRSLIINSITDLSLENYIDDATELFKVCDNMNYITIQTTAHELEYVAWILISRRVSLFNQIKIVNNIFLYLKK
jgi:hypothetical protein